ncbi:uncharacterized protein LOC105630057 [Jatropha curcas]|uniref:uncharacterized protein LOC105630057 n=1 Tax=Jatropha curcas TaxID=180498 RepID=UPI0005FBF029|nr:uncharacterized protein LOC105630057 [Jatropha curcas]
MRRKFWEVARAPFQMLLKDKLKEMEKLETEIIDDLFYYNHQRWCRAFFSANTRCDVVENNMLETFNGWILSARFKSIISMLEDIRVQVMKRIKVMQEFANIWICDIAPTVMEKLELHKLLAMKCQPTWNGDTCFEIVEGEYKHVVDLNMLQCSCRAWKLKGIPYQHAICAMNHKRLTLEDYVMYGYRKEIYLMSYGYFIQLVRGMKLWPESNNPIFLPPEEERKKLGSKKTCRRRDEDEPKRKIGKASRKRVKMTYALCKNSGYNKRGCPQKQGMSSQTAECVPVNNEMPSQRETPMPTQSEMNGTTTNAYSGKEA